MGSFFLFQVGPVQEWIAQARSTRDLWSGSYLISWLMAHALKDVLDQKGSVVFPATDQQPLVRFLQTRNTALRDFGTAAVLTPNLPNRFLASVPENFRPERVEAAFHAQWRDIAGACWKWLNDRQKFTLADHSSLWEEQIARHWQVTWQLWPRRSWAEVEPLWRPLPPAGGEEKGRDRLNGAEGPDKAWVADYELTGHRLDARRQTRDFQAWIAADISRLHDKDAFSGKEEALTPRWDQDRKANWFARANEHRELKYLFRSAEPLGAVNLIKRVWHKASLWECHRLDRTGTELAFESVPGVASAAWREVVRAQYGQTEAVRQAALDFLSAADLAADFLETESRVDPRSGFDSMDGALFHDALWARQERKRPDGATALRAGRGALRALGAAAGLAPAPRYVAVLALDGDQMGKWIGGQILQASEKFHLDFSAMLSKFGITDAREVVGKHHGELIYSGGDDVLALLPAAEAIPCARELAAAFAAAVGAAVAKHPLAPSPSPRATASVGIAIGHMNEPLQDLTAAAQAAEKRAKGKPLDRDALAVTLFKRSGEILEWGAKFGSPAFALHALFAKNFQRRIAEPDWQPPISGRFPHRLAETLRPYETFQRTGGFPDPAKAEPLAADFIEVVAREFTRVVAQQGKALARPDAELLETHARAYLEELAERKAPLRDFHQLFLVEDFLGS